jgi:hypothetical protein
MGLAQGAAQAVGVKRAGFRPCHPAFATALDCCYPIGPVFRQIARKRGQIRAGQ